VPAAPGATSLMESPLGMLLAAAPEASPAPSLTRLEPSGHVHGKPEDGLECMATMEDITEEDGNFCEYQTAPSMSWHAAKFSADVVRRLIYTQFEEYMANVRKADCEADLKRRLAKGPPVWVEDKHALPLPEDDTHVCRIWLASDSEEYSAKLLNCVEEAERDALWEELKKFQPPGVETAAAEEAEAAPAAKAAAEGDK